MNKTNDFKYNLPAYSDPVDIEDLNDNFRGIDDALMAGLCKKDYTGNNMGSSDPSARKYAWAPWLEIVNDNEFDVVVTDRNAPAGSEEATINIAAGQTFRKYINGRYYMNFYVQDQHDVTFKWFVNAETYINESGGGGGGTGTVTSVSVQGGSGSHLTGSGNPIETSGTITINVDEGYSIPSDNEQTAWDGKAADLKFEINSSTFVITAQLKDSSGNLIGNERTIDLPLESVVVSGDYDEQTKKVILTLQNGSTIEFSVADLVSGLQTELNSNNKLNPEYIAYDASHRAVSDTEKGTWNAKQNAISDLETIRSGATAGATAVQPSAMQTALAGKQDSLDQTQLAAVNSGIDSTKVAQISTNQSNILYGLNMGVKNVASINDVTYTAPSGGGYLSVPCGEITGNIVIYFGTISSTDTDASACLISRYYTDGTSEAGGTNRGSNIVNEVSLGSKVLNELRIYPSDNFSHSSGDTLTIDNLMVCTKDAWNQSHDFQPYALPNYDLTRLEAEDRASLAEVVDSGAKNLLDYNSWKTIGIHNGTAVWENNGVTLTATANDCYTNWGASEFPAKIPVKQGQKIVMSWDYEIASNIDALAYIFPNGGSSGSVGIDIRNGYLEYTVSSGIEYITFRVGVMGTGNVAKYKNIMICTKAAFGVSNKFVPYRPNYDLVCSVNKYEKTNMVFSTDAAITNVFDLENSYAYQYYNAFLGKVVVYMDLLTKTSISTLDSKTIAWVKNGTNNTYNFEWTQPVTSGDALFRFTKPNTSTGLVIRLQSGTIASGVHIYVRFEYDIY